MVGWVFLYQSLGKTMAHVLIIPTGQSRQFLKEKFPSDNSKIFQDDSQANSDKEWGQVSILKNILKTGSLPEEGGLTSQINPGVFFPQ